MPRKYPTGPGLYIWPRLHRDYGWTWHAWDSWGRGLGSWEYILLKFSVSFHLFFMPNPNKHTCLPYKGLTVMRQFCLFSLEIFISKKEKKRDCLIRGKSKCRWKLQYYLAFPPYLSSTELKHLHTSKHPCEVSKGIIFIIYKYWLFHESSHLKGTF